MELDRLSRDLSEKLVAARMTAEALSLSAQLARDTVGRWIRGKTVPTLAALRAVEGVLSSRLGYEVDLSEAVRERRTARQRDQLPVLPSPRPEPAQQVNLQSNVTAAPEVRDSLPRDAAAFTGRTEELSRIIAAVAGAARDGSVVAIRAIDGMPGVGKTALAVHAARILREQFPDRQLFINLHAHTPGREPVRAEDALAGLLTAIGVDARYMPGDLDERAAMWRDLMASQRALLVLDNAASSSQVVPLLPGDGGCMVLVTSRRHLGDLPGMVVPVLLDALPPSQAQAMFTRLAPRATGSLGEVAEMVRLAGFLPLAISLLARVFARHPSWTLADLAAETQAGLLTLTAEHDSIATAFTVSYRHLDTIGQRFFRLLGLHLGTTIGSYAAAALAGISLKEAAGLLDALHGEGLLIENGYRRYGMHDLLRRYARDLAAADLDSPGALDRLLYYYQHTAALAEALLARQTRTGPAQVIAVLPDAVPDMTGSTQALAWARAERGNLVACLDHVTATGQHARVLGLTAAMAASLRIDGPWTDAVTRHATAAQAARHLGDHLGQATALNELGSVRRLTGDYPGSIQAQKEALDLYRELGNRLGQAHALCHLGTVQRLTGDYPDAIQALQEALAIYRDLGDRLGQANALHELGVARRRTGDYPGAVQALQEALAIYRDLGDRLGQANALNYLSGVLGQTADYPGAVQAAQQALAICRDLGERLGQANALNYLAGALRRTGDYPGAVQAVREGLDLCRGLGSRLGQANALCELGAVSRLTGDYPEAAQALQEALAIYRDVGDRPAQAEALNHLGAVSRLTGDHPGAARALHEALAIYRDIGDRDRVAEALNEAGTLHRVCGDLSAAESCHQEALELARETGRSWDEAHALAGLGRCALAAGRTADAAEGLRQAQEIFQRIGTAEASGVSTELDTLATSPGAQGP